MSVLVITTLILLHAINLLPDYIPLPQRIRTKSIEQSVSVVAAAAMDVMADVGILRLLGGIDGGSLDKGWDTVRK